jgi:hypothetical protein
VTVMGQPGRAHSRTIPVTCQTHGGGRGYCNLRIRKADGDIVLDPHVTGSCGRPRPTGGLPAATSPAVIARERSDSSGDLTRS